MSIWVNGDYRNLNMFATVTCASYSCFACLCAGSGGYGGYAVGVVVSEGGDFHNINAAATCAGSFSLAVFFAGRRGGFPFAVAMRVGVDFAGLRFAFRATRSLTSADSLFRHYASRRGGSFPLAEAVSAVCRGGNGIRAWASAASVHSRAACRAGSRS